MGATLTSRKNNLITANHIVPFCTLSHSRKISSPPLQLPQLRLTRQIFSSAVFGAPAMTTRAQIIPLQGFKDLTKQLYTCTYTEFDICFIHKWGTGGTGCRAADMFLFCNKPLRLLKFLIFQFNTLNQKCQCIYRKIDDKII